VIRPDELVTSRNAAFQQWVALLTNRSKRHRRGEFLVHGVRPISLALRYQWPLTALLYPYRQRLSAWAATVIDESTTKVIGVDPHLLAELGEKEDTELVAVARIPADQLDRVPDHDDALVVAFDRPTSPGNIGMVIRSADAFGADAVVVIGHAADPYDPKAVRASTGSLFAIPVVRLDQPDPLRVWAHERGVRLVGTDEAGPTPLPLADLARPTILVVGNETRGLSAGLRAICDELVAIPMAGSASSLNAAAAATVVLYEAARQRSRQR
jgi:23S rRNA (uridine2479-2'-O)-methyltransferase